MARTTTITYRLWVLLFAVLALSAFVNAEKEEDKSEVKGHVIGIDLGTTYR